MFQAFLTSLGLRAFILVPEAALLSVQEWRPLAESDFLYMRREFVLYPQPIRFVRLDSEHAQSDGKTVSRGPGQRSRFLVLTKRSAASGDENGAPDDLTWHHVALFKNNNQGKYRETKKKPSSYLSIINLKSRDVFSFGIYCMSFGVIQTL